MKIVLICLIIVLVVIVLSAAKVSGRCSEWERRKEMEDRDED